MYYKHVTCSAKFVDLMDEKKTGAQLMGSFTVMIGDQDEASKCWYFPDWSWLITQVDM